MTGASDENAGLAITDAGEGQGNDLPEATVGEHYNAPLTAAGGSGAYHWSTPSGQMPSALALDENTGVISGIPGPQASGTTSITVQVSDGTATVQRAFSLKINPHPSVLTIRNDSLPEGMVGAPYSAAFHASGGSGDYAWSVISLAMPNGLTLDGKTGAISGTPGRLAEGAASITVQVSDGSTATKRTFALQIAQALRISNQVEPSGSDAFKLNATGGVGDHEWKMISGTAPDWLSLDESGTILIYRDNLTHTETRLFTAMVSDQKQHTDKAGFYVRVRPAPRWRRVLHLTGPATISRLDIDLRAKRRWPSLSRLGHLTFWLGILALWVPLFGAAWIFVYALTTPGSHGTYLGVGMLTAIAALLIGCLIGFLFGIPRVVSSGQVRLGQSSEYAPSSNLSEVSDWLTKLLLGAGLVQLTHLGAPLGDLIDHVAAALYVGTAYAGPAKVTAGTIIFGYVAIGLLDGYVVTTMWYQRRLASDSNA
jgi:hypothetical protein